jgi:GT2 family glycosyltransferase
MSSEMIIMIATAGRAELLERTLASIAAAEKPPTYRETLVIENGEQCGTQEKVERFAAAINARYLHVPMPSKSNALNVALQSCGHELIVFLDDDCRLEPRTLMAYADAAEAGGRHYFGGPIGIDYEEEPPDWLKVVLPFSARGFDLGPEPIEIRLPDFLGINWAARAEDLREAGGFDVSFGPGTGASGQETAMMQRLLDLGLTGRYLPEALVWHFVPRERCSVEWAIARSGPAGHGLGRMARQTGRPRLARSAYYLGLLPLYVVERTAGRLMGRTDLVAHGSCMLRHRIGHLRGMWLG